MNTAQVQKTAVFDVHMQFGEHLFQRSWLDADIERVTQAWPQLAGCLIPVKPKDYLLPAANRACQRAASQRPGWIAATRCDPWRLDESLEALAQSASKVLFLHPFEEQFYPTSEATKRLIEAASGQSMVVFLAAGYSPFSHPAQVYPLLQEFPQVKFLLSHGAQINICGLHLKEAFEIFKDCPNAYFETSGIYRQDYIERAIAELGAERVVFGSGSPVYDFDYECQRVLHLDIEDSQRQQVFSKSAQALFGLEASQ